MRRYGVALFEGTEWRARLLRLPTLARRRSNFSSRWREHVRCLPGGGRGMMRLTIVDRRPAAAARAPAVFSLSVGALREPKIYKKRSFSDRDQAWPLTSFSANFESKSDACTLEYRDSSTVYEYEIYVIMHINIILYGRPG